MGNVDCGQILKFSDHGPSACLFFQIVSVIVCMFGVCCVLQPWTDDFNPSLEAIILGYSSSIMYGVLLAIDMGIVHHYTYLQKHENQNIVIFWMLLFGTVISVVISACIERQKLALPNNATDWLLVVGHCGGYGAIISLNIYVYSVLPGVLVSLISSTTLLYLVLAQYTFLSHIHAGNHNWLELFGAGLVLFSSIAPSLKKIWDQYYDQESQKTSCSSDESRIAINSD